MVEQGGGGQEMVSSNRARLALAVFAVLAVEAVVVVLGTILFDLYASRSPIGGGVVSRPPVEWWSVAFGGLGLGLIVLPVIAFVVGVVMGDRSAVLGILVAASVVVLIVLYAWSSTEMGSWDGPVFRPMRPNEFGRWLFVGDAGVFSPYSEYYLESDPVSARAAHTTPWPLGIGILVTMTATGAAFLGVLASRSVQGLWRRWRRSRAH